MKGIFNSPTHGKEEKKLRGTAGILHKNKLSMQLVFCVTKLRQSGNYLQHFECRCKINLQRSVMCVEILSSIYFLLLALLPNTLGMN